MSARVRSYVLVALTVVACGTGQDPESVTATTSDAVGQSPSTVGSSAPATTPSDSDSSLVFGLEPGTARVTIGNETILFTTEDGPGASCRTDRLGSAGGIVAIGYEVDERGELVDGGMLEMNVYAEDWVPEGKQANSITVSGSGDRPDWSTAGVSRIEDNPDVDALTDAAVSSWRLSGGESFGLVTFYDEDSLQTAQAGGDLVLASGSFEVHCAR